ncbi:MAG TPA: Ig-like domain-containing protein, partial [Chitinophagales bacterium]|nr:Ig-like domain-containing protein [Chitinophagales bacterium]
MKKFLCYCLCVLLGSAALSAQITVYLQYPTDSIAVINPLQDLSGVVAVDITFTAPQRGVVTLLPDGTLQYVANSMTDVVYGDVFNFSVFDGISFYNRYVNITPQFDDPMPNVPPLGSTITHTVCSDQANPTPSSIYIGLYDLNFDVHHCSIVQNASYGTTNLINADETTHLLTYLPEQGFTGVDTVIYRVCETNTTEQYCADGLVLITVQDCYSTTVKAWDDLYYMSDTTTITINPLQDDFADFLPVTITIVSQGNWGTAVVNPDNTLTYSLNDTVPIISDQLTYQLCDALGNCSDTATITIVGATPNWQPLYPISSNFVIAPQQSVELDFLPDDIYFTPEIYIDTILSQLQYGTLEPIADGKYLYTPFEGLVAPEGSFGWYESINYIACLPYSNCVTNDINISIAFINCIDDYAFVPYQNAVTIPVLGNDWNHDLLNITAINTPPQHGTVTITDNQLLYQPDSSYYGVDTLQYIACDMYGNCDTATVSIFIDVSSYSGNLPPIMSVHQVGFCKEHYYQSGLNVLNSFGVQYGETFDIIITEAPHFGTAYFDNTGFYYTPLPILPTNESYYDTLRYTICETNTIEQYCTDNELVLHVIDCNSASVIANDSYFYVYSNSFPEIIVPVDVEADFWNTISLTVLNEGQYGTTQVHDDQTLSYLLNDSMPAGSIDSIQYVACNELGVCDTAYIFIESLGYECCTLTVPDSYDVPAGVAQSLAVLENDFPGLHIVGIVDTPQYGSVSFTDASVVYTAIPQHYNQYDQFAYIACDDLGRCDTAIVSTLSVINNDNNTVNYAPFVYDGYATACEENTLDIWQTVYDANSQDILQCTFSPLPSHGTIDTIQGYNSLHIIYTPDDNYEGVDTIRCVWCETNTSELFCTEGVLTINVLNCLSNFSAMEDYAYFYRDSTMTVTFNVLANDWNEDSLSIASVSIVSSPNIGTAIVNADNTITYTYVDTTDCYTTPNVRTTFECAVCTVSGICDTVPVSVDAMITPSPLDVQTVVISASQPHTFVTDGVNNILYPSLYGSTVLNPDNSITYTPYPDSTDYHYKLDNIVYTSCEPYFVQQEHIINLGIIEDDKHFLDAIVARDDYAVIYWTAPIDVLANDTYIDIPYSDFGFYNFQVIEPPTFGSVEAYDPMWVQYIPYNEVVVDSFRYVLCSYIGDVSAANPVQMCDTATVYILPSCDNICLYPGDVNNDQTVNTLDFLAFGIAPATTGSPRPDASNMWMGQEVTPWDEYFTYQPFGETLLMNQSLADCNGDGTITLS